MAKKAQKNEYLTLEEVLSYTNQLREIEGTWRGKKYKVAYKSLTNRDDMVCMKALPRPSKDDEAAWDEYQQDLVEYYFLDMILRAKDEIPKDCLPITSIEEWEPLDIQLKQNIVQAIMVQEGVDEQLFPEQ